MSGSRPVTAREMRASLDLAGLADMADRLGREAMVSGLRLHEVAALGALLAGSAAAAVAERQRDAWMMNLAEIADLHEQEVRRQVDELDLDMAPPADAMRAMEALIAKAAQDSES